ncbi:bifunctional (p)ppGpp synthetase/guanosine-3',5'-bis(diphosphate) 3'-pyrophosphohydrolase [Sandaracinobacter sp. RS1-74]|uniref:RelA/SpoT family protein n=1 Tax=Sandaracinobacteroides sayramensis TaxID=2913411 RepID=UPI001EDA2922|nr:bifunctional (p)ppGpp synthetase/guanosine-3',5'-bis(diphosphate) 3'-pyrophosphohydrolase [Sandaracinobacteroides sayramensis]MCG2839675.1 bifunctional (p)ppGpp synthetase/guanosine-3',5'-bis(diphosphate) 3'-pyrophosphohydrolase [Sandaracinobacteroides sayramensis]
MLRQYELVERVKSYDPQADEDLLNRAYVFSMKAHGSQLRASGDPYFSHPIEVAGILTDLNLDDETIVTAILHDTIEDTVATPDDIRRLFGENVARLVEGVTKLSRIEAQTESERAAENLRRFLLAMSDDIRVLLVKLADRLHNMRTLKHLKNPEKRRRIARETMDIYAPLAERIGMYGFMDELKELSFAELEPEAYQSINKRLEALRAGGGDTVKRIESGIRHTLESAGVPVDDVRGREKRPWSIFRKMQERHVAFEQLSDVMAFRVITRSPDDCYRALGALHRRWPMVPGRFKDYISTPKRNGYRSLHTTLVDRAKMRIEVQIRDADMHAEAEYGMAAHWAYKQRQGAGGTSYPWLTDLLEILDNAQSPEEVLEHTRIAMFQDQLFCFTPKGELVQLPRGSTPVDFAYAVHTTLGDTCVGARVNGKVVPLRTRLHNGDQVEILRSSAQTPDPAWEQFAVTAKARSAVRRHMRQKTRAAQLKTGEALFHDAVTRLKVEIGAEAIAAALKRLKLSDQSALFVALATAQVSDAQLVEALVPGSATQRRARRKSPPTGVESAILVAGGADMGSMEMGSCCMPVPGDRIVGLRVPDHGIEVHTIDCPRLAAAEDGEWVDLKWAPDASSGTARVEVVVMNEPGALAQVTAILAQQGANIVNLQLKDRDRAHHRYIMDVEVDDLKHLSELVAGLRAPSLVVTAERMQG